MLKQLMTKISSISSLKALYLEIFFNNTSKVSKISQFSVLNAHAFGISKLFQKNIKDVAIVESLMFPELSSGAYLDRSASLICGVERYGACGSSTYVLVYADSGTVYIPGESTFVSNQGVIFNILEVSIVGDNNYLYIPVRSSNTGLNTNVDALTINNITNPPLGHLKCTNEFSAVGGRDSESDTDFKERLSSFPQFASISTMALILNNLKTIDNNILSIMKAGYTTDGKILLSLVTVNGQYYTADELSYFESQLSNFLTLSDIDVQGIDIGIQLQNVQWFEVGGSSVGVDFRVDIYSGYVEADVRKDIQIAMTKYFDFRFWNKTKVEWDDLLQIVKSVTGVRYVPDEYFYPGVDQIVDLYKLPRVIKFIMRDLDGNILYNNNSAALPIYYPSL